MVYVTPLRGPVLQELGLPDAAPAVKEHQLRRSWAFALQEAVQSQFSWRSTNTAPLHCIILLIIS
jgi:hypothetical protein